MPNDNHSNRSRQVNLGQKAGVKSASAHNKKKKNKKRKNTVIITILLLIIVSIIVFLIVGGRAVYNTIVAPKNDVKDVSVTLYQTTPESDKDKVAYYVLGLMGENVDSPTELLSILCYDKQKKAVNILQIPQDTYIDNAEIWKVKRVSEVWTNPKPLDWCNTCRKQVPPSEISDGKHSVCGTEVTQMTGSAHGDLCKVFNLQYGLPVDGYFMIPQQGLVKLVNLLGGVDVNLESSMTVGDIKYNSGVQTLDGDAALYYATNRAKGINGDIDRMVRSRKVFLGVFQRLIRQSKDKLTKDSIGPLMSSSKPISSNLKRTDMINLLLEMNAVKSSSMAAYVIPGVAGKTGGSTYFSARKADLLSLINQSFNPYGAAIAENSLGLTELSKGGKIDLRKQLLSEIESAQSGAAVTTAASETTKVAK